MYQAICVFVILALFAAESVVPLKFVSREEWGAKPPKFVNYINGAADYVIIHHSEFPICKSKKKCANSMNIIQDYHQRKRGWSDIGYNFVVGGDGKVYEGRGFSAIGAHAPQFNAKSIGICLIGDWSHRRPPRNMLRATQELIELAVERGELAPDYNLHGHRQVKQTACPGKALFNKIKRWPHFVAT